MSPTRIDQLWGHRCVAKSLTPHLITSVLNILTDIMCKNPGFSLDVIHANHFIVLLTGFSIIRTLQLTTQQIRASLIIFFIAFLTISAACIRMGSQIFSYTDGHGGFEPYPPENKLNPETLSNIATDMEIYIAGIAACLPGIRLFMRRQINQIEKRKAVGQMSTLESGSSQVVL